MVSCLGMGERGIGGKVDSFCGMGEAVNSSIVWKRQTLGMVEEESRQAESCHGWGQTLAMV